MSPKRKTTALDGSDVERTTDIRHEVGLRPELRPEPLGEPWPPVMDFKVEYILLRGHGQREFKMSLYLRGKKVKAVVAILGITALLVYSAVTHDHGIFQRFVELLRHLK